MNMLNKSMKGFKTMFKNIDLNKLTLAELRLLLKCIDLYASEHNNEKIVSEELLDNLNKYGDLICEEIQRKEYKLDIF